MRRLSAEIAPGRNRPVKVLQFGEGNFLRAFVDYMLDIANESGQFDGGIVIVKPIPFGDAGPVSCAGLPLYGAAARHGRRRKGGENPG